MLKERLNIYESKLRYTWSWTNGCNTISREDMKTVKYILRLLKEIATNRYVIEKRTEEISVGQCFGGEDY